MTIKFSSEQVEKLKAKIKKELILELDSRKARLDESDIDFIASKVQSKIKVETEKLDVNELAGKLLRQVVISEHEKHLAFNKDKILTKEVRTDFINDVLDRIEKPKDGAPGQKGEPGKDGKDYKLTRQDKIEIGKTIDGVVTTDIFNQRYLQLIKDIKSGKIKLPAHGGKSNPYEPFLKITAAGDDKGLRVENGQFSVGSLDDGREAVFGEGDSHTIGLAVLTTTDGVSFLDVTTEASSDTGSTFFTFGGGSPQPGAAFYVGSDRILCGIKLKTATTVDEGTGIAVREFWDGLAWTSFTTMVTDADAPYQSRADDIGTIVGSEQVRFGRCETQQKTTVNGIEKYWIRFRVTSAFVLDGTTEQVKLHTNRYEVNADGFTEYFGTGIYQADLLMHWGLSQELSGFSPLSQNIQFADEIELVYTSNRLPNGQTSGRGGYLIIPDGLDTSKGITGEILFAPLDNAAGDVLWEVYTYQTGVGDILSASNTATVFQDVSTVDINTANTLYKADIDVDVQNLLPGEILSFGFKRIGADVLDTYSGGIAIVNIRSFGRFWKP